MLLRWLDGRAGDLSGGIAVMEGAPETFSAEEGDRMGKCKGARREFEVGISPPRRPMRLWSSFDSVRGLFTVLLTVMSLCTAIHDSHGQAWGWWRPPEAKKDYPYHEKLCRESHSSYVGLAWNNCQSFCTTACSTALDLGHLFADGVYGLGQVGAYVAGDFLLGEPFILPNPRNPHPLTSMGPVDIFTHTQEGIARSMLEIEDDLKNGSGNRTCGALGSMWGGTVISGGVGTACQSVLGRMLPKSPRRWPLEMADPQAVLELPSGAPTLGNTAYSQATVGDYRLHPLYLSGKYDPKFPIRVVPIENIIPSKFVGPIPHNCRYIALDNKRLRICNERGIPPTFEVVKGPVNNCLHTDQFFMIDGDRFFWPGNVRNCYGDGLAYLPRPGLPTWEDLLRARLCYGRNGIPFGSIEEPTIRIPRAP